MPHPAELLRQRDELLRQLEDPKLPAARTPELLAKATQLGAELDRSAQRADAVAALRAAQVAPPPPPRRTPSAGAVPSGKDTRLGPGEDLTLFRARTGQRGQTLNLGLGYPETRALLDSSPTSAGAFLNPPRLQQPVQATPDRPLTVTDLLPQPPLENAGSIEYAQESSSPVAAETVPGQPAPEASYTFTERVDPVRDIAAWVPISRQALDDNQQLLEVITGRLRYAAAQRADSQILNGDGTGVNLRGIFATAGVQTYTPGAAEAALLSIRKGMTRVHRNNGIVSGVVLHPDDAERVDLSQDTAGMLRLPPSGYGADVPRLWGAPGVITTAIAAGTVLVGDFRQAATLWVRGSTVQTSEQHADFAIRNQTAVLLTLRVALSIWRPSVLCKVTLVGTT